MNFRQLTALIASAFFLILATASCSSDDPPPQDQKELEKTQANSPDIDATKG